VVERRRRRGGAGEGAAVVRIELERSGRRGGAGEERAAWAVVRSGREGKRCDVYYRRGKEERSDQTITLSFF
jgi:hypothetical protein